MGLWDKWMNKVIPKENTQKILRISYGVIWNVFLIFVVMALVGFSFAGGMGAGYFASLVKNERIRGYAEMKKDIYNYEETSEIFFDDTSYMGKLNSDLERKEVKLYHISPVLINAVIATEDQYFYQHNGIVPKAVMRAIFQEVTNSPVKSGGSTLTQQLIKNQILTNEVSFDRKAKELLLALRLEKFFDKKEILEAYLNIADMGRDRSGRNIAGVQTAAQGIFGMNAKNLSLPEAAFIAGLPQSPFGYTPFTNKGEIKQDLSPGISRMKTVLRRMYQQGFITEQELNKSLAFDVKSHLLKKRETASEKYPWLTSEIEKRAKMILLENIAKESGYSLSDLYKHKEQLAEYKALADKQLKQNGYRIYTTIHKDIFENMQQAAKDYHNYGRSLPAWKRDPDTGKKIRVMEPVEVGAMMIENSTGKILSFVGGRDHEREQLNHATSSLRSIGSTMKPLLVYGPAIEEGVIQPGTVIPDFPTKGYNPNNYDKAIHGLVSARKALAKSYNMAAVNTYKEIKASKPVTFLEKMGITSLTAEDKENDSLSIGAMHAGITVEENVNAYTTFANGGSFKDAYLIEKIESADGTPIYQHQKKEIRVFTPQTAYLTLDMMRDVIKEGTARSLLNKLSLKSDWAGKTGTAQNYDDAWFVASNPAVTFGTWIGYDSPKPLPRETYSQKSLGIWAKLMNAAYKAEPEIGAAKKSFKMPKGIVSRTFCSISGELSSNLCREAGLEKTDLFDSQHVPVKPDDSLIKGRYFTVNGKAFPASSNLPSEFLREGVMVKESLLERYGIKSASDLETLFPNNPEWSRLIVSEGGTILDDGKVPSPVTGIRFSGASLIWSTGKESDLIGYRVYSDPNGSGHFVKIGSLPADEQPSLSVGTARAIYYVTAVDAEGNESEPSSFTAGSLYTPPESSSGDNQGQAAIGTAPVGQ
ncbi:transglycosylase domain-containing protein [Metabacillus sp. RGM 3146]|uniref:transglycosylase domain-containing protein n=1 Tax=Metabacillus sp. RGM 3146 TaxID=3401092 RepID=UPI003B991C72